MAMSSQLAIWQLWKTTRDAIFICIRYLYEYIYVVVRGGSYLVFANSPIDGPVLSHRFRATGLIFRLDLNSKFEFVLFQLPNYLINTQKMSRIILKCLNLVKRRGLADSSRLENLTDSSRQKRSRQSGKKDK